MMSHQLHTSIRPVMGTTAFFLFCSAILLAAFGPAQGLAASAAEDDVDIKSIIDRVDRLYRSRTSMGEMEMEVSSTHWKRTLSMKIWTEGMDKTLIFITGPKKDEGIATLRIGTEMWNYFPKINKVMKVPPSMMMSSWMGSDFSNDDLVKESSLLHDYNSALVHPDGEKPGFYYIALTPKIDTPTVWGKILITIRKDDYIPVKEIYFDEKGREMRVMTFSDIRAFGNRNIPSMLEMVPLGKEGQKTVIRYHDIRFDEPLDEEVFTLRNLQRRR